MSKTKMSNKDKADWDALYEYVRVNILGYDSNQALSKHMVLRLKGLCSNKYIENNSIAKTANYSFEIVLLTFKYCKQKIDKALQSKEFVDENHKFNYILAIVNSNLNTVYLKVKKNNQAVEEITHVIDVPTANHQQASYKTISKNETNSSLNDLW